VEEREIAILVGSNGAVKTSNLDGIVILFRSIWRVSCLNDDISRSQTHQIVRRGLALVPEDRQGEGVVQIMSIQANMTLSDFSLQGFRRAGRWLNPQKEESCV
ncbi:hypothetical protein LAM87_21885, partial [Mycobacterium tuberculosis]|nr:hypothetical protein [Mycobacterium tuberculosis]